VTLLTFAAQGILERWPLLVAIPLGLALIRWRRSIGKALSSFYGAEFPQSSDHESARATRNMAELFWSIGMLVLGGFMLVVPLLILAGV
jgi:hypothetical protein